MPLIDELVTRLSYELKNTQVFKQHEQHMTRMQRSTEQAARATEKAAERISSSVARTVRNGYMLISAAVTAGAGFLAKNIISTSAQFETFETTLTTIEGSAGKAKKSMDWISKFAVKTPYEVGELTAAFVKLRSYGIDPMNGTMEVLGDTASAMGKPLNQAVEAFADAATNNFERLKEFGIVASSEGSRVTLSYVKDGKTLTKTVRKNGIEITNALKQIWGDRFAGAMVRQSKTWAGMISNLSDAWGNLMLRIGRGGIFEAVKKRLADLLDMIARWDADGTLDRIAEGFNKFYFDMVRQINLMTYRWERFRDWFNNWDVWEKLKAKNWSGVGSELGKIVSNAFKGEDGEGGVDWFDVGMTVLRKIIDGFSAVKSFFDGFWDKVFEEYKWLKQGETIGGKLLEGMKRAFGNIWGHIFGDYSHSPPNMGVPDITQPGGTGTGGAHLRHRRGGRPALEPYGSPMSIGGGGGRGPNASLGGGGRFNPGSFGGSGDRRADAIIEAEGTAARGNPYDEVVYYGKHGKPSRPLSDMTLREVYEHGLAMRRSQYAAGKPWDKTSSASGAFQIVGQTMKKFMGEAGLGWDDKFNADNQRKLQDVIWRRQGPGAWEGFKRNPGALRRAIMGGSSGTGAWSPEFSNFHQNLQNMDSIRGDIGRSSIDKSSRVSTNNINVNAPVNVQKATDAPEAVAGSVKSAARKAAELRPSRMQAGPATALA